MASVELPEAVLSGLRQSSRLADERERLRSAVVEAAQKWCRNYRSVLGINGGVEPILKLRDAVDALNAFEASHAIGQKDGESG